MTAQPVLSSRSCLGATLLFSMLWSATAHADTLTLMWDASEGSVSGYAVYAGNTAEDLSQRIDVGVSTLLTLSNAVPGMQYCFAVAAYNATGAEGPRSTSVCGYTNQSPSLVNPGSQSSMAGQPDSLQLTASDPDGQPLTFSASGLPPGLAVMQSTGFISGTPSASGTYQVTAHAWDGVLADAESFTWTVTEPPTADTTAPLLSITSPTSSSTYTASTGTLAMSGLSSDDVGVTSVSWASDRGGSGTAVGVSPWSASVPLQLGSNVITVRAQDAAGNASTRVLTVTYADSTRPVVTITSPTTSDTYANLFSTVMLAGSASDNVGVTSVSWTSDRGGSGMASGTSSWSVPSVSLQEGDNVITVSARDAAGNVSTDVLTVTYVLPVADDPDPVVLSGSLSTKGWRTVAIFGWSTIPGSDVDVLRDGVVVARTSNNGKYWEELPSAGTWTYQVCATDGSVCSNTVSLTGGTDGDPDAPGRPGGRNK